LPRQATLNHPSQDGRAFRAKPFTEIPVNLWRGRGEGHEVQAPTDRRVNCGQRRLVITHQDQLALGLEIE
jgi:hypothetical protein